MGIKSLYCCGSNNNKLQDPHDVALGETTRKPEDNRDKEQMSVDEHKEEEQEVEPEIDENYDIKSLHVDDFQHEQPNQEVTNHEIRKGIYYTGECTKLYCGDTFMSRKERMQKKKDLLSHPEKAEAEDHHKEGESKVHIMM